MSEWQDISTAPKDGTEVLIWCSHCDSQILAVWGCANHNCYDNCCAEAGGEDAPMWRDTFGLNDIEDNWHRPTHWMPLPPPPKDSK